jgi:hypothetical protein
MAEGGERQKAGDASGGNGSEPKRLPPSFRISGISLTQARERPGVVHMGAAAEWALAAAQRIDEVKEIRDKAIAPAAYAFQAKDAELMGFATEIKKRAVRRLGEVMDENRKAGKLSQGTKGSKVKGARVDEKPTLESQGIDKNLADAARKAAATLEERYEASSCRCLGKRD